MQARGNVILEPVVTPNLVEQLIHETGNFADALDRALTAQTSYGLRLRGRNRIYGLFQVPLDFCRTAGSRARQVRCCAHAASPTFAFGKSARKL